MNDLADTLRRAISLHRGGQLAEAEAVYRQLLAADPELPDAWHLLGLIFHQTSRTAEALEAIEKALVLRPNDPTFLCNLGSVLNGGNRHAEAIDPFERSLNQNPQQPKAWYNYGNALRNLGRNDDAAVAYQRAISLDPEYAEAHSNLGVLLRDLGRSDEAVAHYRAALQLKPQLASAHFNLANALRALPEPSQHELREQRWSEVLGLYQEAIRLKPDYHEAYTNLGVLFKELDRLDEAAIAYQKAIEVRPDFAEAHSNLGIAYQDLGLIDQAQRSLERALELKPGFAEVHSNLLFVRNYDSAFDQPALLAEHRRFGETQTRHIPHDPITPCDPDPDRRLRIGYVSPDLKSHPVGQFIAPIFANANREKFETFVYADVEKQDTWTTTLRGQVDQWHNVLGKSDEQLAGQIRADEIDILIDLAGHTAFNRLLVFARRAASVQVSYLGYPNTTGLEAMDYLLTDAVADPPGVEGLYTERLVRLAPCFSCYRPPDNAPEVNDLPARRSGMVTFGSLHNLAKLNSQVLDLWADLLRRVTNSRLLLFRNTLLGSAKVRLVQEFTARGIKPERVDYRHQLPPSGEHLPIYHEIDIALDTFPWSGHTTACEALWMGIPVVSLLGDRHAGRMVASVLQAVGRSEWVAQSPDEYLTTAERLAGEPEQLEHQRKTLRDTIRTSPQCNGPDFTRNLERAYRQMWQETVRRFH